jgi:hypothetical protein
MRMGTLTCFWGAIKSDEALRKSGGCFGKRTEWQEGIFTFACICLLYVSDVCACVQVCIWYICGQYLPWVSVLAFHFVLSQGISSVVVSSCTKYARLTGPGLSGDSSVPASHLAVRALELPTRMAALALLYSEDFSWYPHVRIAGLYPLSHFPSPNRKCEVVVVVNMVRAGNHWEMTENGFGVRELVVWEVLESWMRSLRSLCSPWYLVGAYWVHSFPWPLPSTFSPKSTELHSTDGNAAVVRLHPSFSQMHCCW